MAQTLTAINRRKLVYGKSFSDFPIAATMRGSKGVIGRRRTSAMGAATSTTPAGHTVHSILVTSIVASLLLIGYSLL